MNRLKNRVFNSPVIMTWFSFVVKFGSALFLLPLILLKLPQAEIAVWFVFSLIISLAQLADSGFGPTVVRATSYFYAGAQLLPKSPKELKENKHNTTGKINYQGLKKLLNTFSVVYLGLGIFSVILLLTIGKLIVNNSIEMTSNQTNLNIAFYVITVRVFIDIQSVRWSSFIQGVDKVALLKRIETLINALRIISAVISLSLGYGILAITIIDFVYRSAFLISTRHTVLKWFKFNNYRYHQNYKFNSTIFKSIWPATWRFGAMQYGGYFTNNGTAIVVSQLSDPQLISSFLLSQRLIFFIRQVSQAPLYANLPRIFHMLALKDFFGLKKYCAKNITFGLIMQFLALSFLILFGNTLIEYFNFNTTLISQNILTIMAITIMLEAHHAFHAQIYMGSNHVPFMFPGLISGAAIVGLGFVAVAPYGILGIVLVQFFVQLSFNNWYPVYMNFKLLNWNLKEYFHDLLQSVKDFKTVLR